MSNQSSALQPPLRAVSMGLYDTADSLQDVVDWADAQLPISNRNTLISVLFMYHNTLLKMIEEQKHLN